MKNVSKLILMACVTTLMGIQVQAQNPQLDEVIVNADKDKPTYEDGTFANGYLSEKTSLGLQKNKNLMEIPASAMTITNKAINDFAISGNNEIMDILSLNPAIRRTTSPNVVSVRGKYTTASQMSVNNIPGMFSNFTMGTNFIGDIDVLSGPSLVYSGSTTQNVVGGTINYRSKRAGMTPLNNFKIKYTGDSNFQESLDVSRKFGKGNDWGIRINTMTGDGKLAVHGEKLKNRNIFVNLDHNSEVSSTNLFMGYAKTIHQGGNSIFQTVSSSAKNYRQIMPRLPSAPDGSHNLNPSWAYQESRTWIMTLNHDQKINNHWSAYVNAGIMKNDTPVNITGSSMSSILQFEKDGSFNGTFKRTLSISASGNTARYLGAGLKSDYQLGAMNNEFIIGVDRNGVINRTSSSRTLGTFIGNLYHDNDWGSPDLTAPGTRLGSKYVTKGFSILDTMKFLDDKLIINAGVHHHTYQSRSYNAKGTLIDRSSYNGNCPAFGIVYRITPNFSAYVAHTETFLGGTVVQTGKGYKNEGALLDPAKTKSNEFGFKFKTGTMMHTLAFYKTKEPGLITTVDKYLTYDGETQYKGIEWTTAGSIGEKWNFIASLGFNRYIWTKNADSTLNGKTADGIPKWNGNLALDYKPNKEFTILGRLSYIGKSHIGHGTYTVPQYYRFDAGMKYDTKLGEVPVTLSAMCYNVTDKKGWYTADQGNQLLAADPRTFMFSAEFRF